VVVFSQGRSDRVRAATARTGGSKPHWRGRLARSLSLTLGLTLLATTTGCGRRQQLGPPRAVPVAKDGGLELKLMTYNIRYENTGDRGTRSWRSRIIGSVRMIRDEAPDIIGLQEALHGQAADLWASLPDYAYLGIARDDGHRSGEYSGILYRRDRFLPDPEDQGTFWLSDTPESPGSMTWGNGIPRIVTWAKFRDLASQRAFYVFNTHWDHQSQPSRERASILVAERIDARRDAEAPVVLMGDFNARENNPAVAYLTGARVTLADTSRQWANPLVETFDVVNPGAALRSTIHFWRNDIPPSAKIDHILVSPGAGILAAAVRRHDQPPVSDHYPVTAHVVFPAPPGKNIRFLPPDP